MNGKFLPSGEVERDTLDWGQMGWLSRPSTTGAGKLAVIDVTLNPGKGHNFHKHPDQEEVIYLIDGKIEQWIEEEKRELVPGDSVFIAADVVHASFNIGSGPVKLIAILGPCSGPEGYALVDVADQEPWSSLRS